MSEWMPLLELTRHIIAGGLMFGGAVFMLIGASGVLRLPDFYSRIHAAGITDTLATLLLIAGMMLESGFTQTSAKLALVAIFLFLTSPTATHAIANAAHKAGLKPRLGTIKPAHPRQDKGA
ncbi:Na(+) H(+) antiporter subunit G [hydrothermal vent metagenome]|uniref:Na(+) H(+) antiporter subunit G n=1 Tax=hydrothermal vent metagenome TaxID=652676 RepID=A0A3B0S648_9ZZZZ